MMTDPIADMLTRIRNASAAKRSEVLLPYSRLKHEIARVLTEENYLARAERIEEEGTTPKLRLVLKYRSNGRPYIKHLRRLSVPSRRLYVNTERLPHVLNGFGIALISSSKGIMTNKRARKEKIGGELLLEIW
ncbi:MAG: 30S ribosomal protein S8 [Candidatus Komeilibacteria bacterium RIFCSPLOWO2_01_FULL_52_15]|uniref:Small ribosomal subunit protein uS8 n=2 Tax=Candidatus Komeiliibacteriota TaxID=1817908 RepID=A0A1G2BR11_9BACT|nr:MAG: 30S ribosomal protein S8 [Candidatus Komeilibacteria bacterium RIFCSPHIGHO2_01_FULL_52_14]OGY91009.1 MAG: 30S ribosomal protein S8 [Candidatus Komeilibacteria bacterium RIFCSPLOWO2_01_FULL_52_15]